MEIAKTHVESIKHMRKPKKENRYKILPDPDHSSCPLGTGVMEGCPRQVYESDFALYDGYKNDYNDWN